jgi:small subunit ribosomal protein S6
VNEFRSQDGTKFPGEGEKSGRREKMRQYETIFIVNPSLVEDTYREVVNKFRNIIEKQKGVVVKVEEWGNQRLAYGVKKFDKGLYVLLNYCGEAGITSELERDLKLDDRVLKFQTVKIAEGVDPQSLMVKDKDGKKEPEAKESLGTPAPAAAPVVPAVPGVPAETQREQAPQEVKSDVG